MKTNLLSSDKDPMGTAIADYFHHNKADKLRVFSSQFEEDEIPVNQLFRPYDEMPELEQIALQMAEGNTLDVGAGSGCHALALQEMGKEVCAIDISPRSVEVMEKRGVRNVEGGNLAASKIRNLECPNYEICLIDYGCGKFNRKIHIMEQYP